MVRLEEKSELALGWGSSVADSSRLAFQLDIVEHRVRQRAYGHAFSCLSRINFLASQASAPPRLAVQSQNFAAPITRRPSARAEPQRSRFRATLGTHSSRVGARRLRRDRNHAGGSGIALAEARRRRLRAGPHAGPFGSKRRMAAQLGVEGGRPTSAAKTVAARRNWPKGGRPRKSA